MEDKVLENALDYMDQLEQQPAAHLESAIVEKIYQGNSGNFAGPQTDRMRMITSQPRKRGDHKSWTIKTLIEKIAFNIVQGRVEAEDEGFDEGFEGQPAVTELVK